jgi:hypothetical protein
MLERRGDFEPKFAVEHIRILARHFVELTSCDGRFGWDAGFLGAIAANLNSSFACPSCRRV